MAQRWLAGWMLFLLLTACGSSGDEDEAPLAGGPLNYLAAGASDAFGIGADPLENGYVYRIEETLENERGESVDLINTGVPGALADDILEAVDLALAVGSDPDLVTLWTGANDLTQGRTPEAFRADLEALLARLQDTGALIFIGDLPDLTALPRFVEEPDPDVTAARVAIFNGVIEELAALFGATLVPLSAVPFQDDLTSDADGFHPSNEGHARIAEEFLLAIRPPLGLPQP